MNLEGKLKQAIKSNDDKLIYEAFENIYLEYAKIVCFKIMEYIKDQDIAEDLMQDVFINFFNKIKLIEPTNIKYYLLVSAKNKALDYLKSKNPLILDEEYVLGIDEISNDNYDVNLYNETINRMKKVLNNFEIEIILKHTLDNMSFKALSKLYKKSINTILTTYYRSIKKIKEELKNEKYSS